MLETCWQRFKNGHKNEDNRDSVMNSMVSFSFCRLANSLTNVVLQTGYRSHEDCVYLFGGAIRRHLLADKNKSEEFSRYPEKYEQKQNDSPILPGNCFPSYHDLDFLVDSEELRTDILVMLNQQFQVSHETVKQNKYNGANVLHLIVSPKYQLV